MGMVDLVARVIPRTRLAKEDIQQFIEIFDSEKGIFSGSWELSS
jgi:hypothetical protein